MALSIEKLVIELSQHLVQQRLHIAAAESCTGGGLCYELTRIAGSSEWFERGFVTYSNAAKVEMLGVNAMTLQTYGAVSAQVAQSMAEGALRNSHATLAIAITGIAGPDGGTASKPVGTVWFAIAKRHHDTLTQHQCFTGNRATIRTLSLEHALSMLISYVATTSD